MISTPALSIYRYFFASSCKGSSLVFGMPLSLLALANWPPAPHLKVLASKLEYCTLCFHLLDSNQIVSLYSLPPERFVASSTLDHSGIHFLSAEHIKQTTDECNSCDEGYCVTTVLFVIASRHTLCARTSLSRTLYQLGQCHIIPNTCNHFKRKLLGTESADSLMTTSLHGEGEHTSVPELKQS